MDLLPGFFRDGALGPSCLPPPCLLCGTVPWKGATPALSLVTKNSPVGMGGIRWLAEGRGGQEGGASFSPLVRWETEAQK